MKKAYDSQHAQKLLPLLQSIGQEVTERLHEIRILRGRITAHEQGDWGVEQLMGLKASLANHKREVRLAGKELERLGCVLDEDVPGRILIPGTDGEVAHGFIWEASDLALRRTSTGGVIG